MTPGRGGVGGVGGVGERGMTEPEGAVVPAGITLPVPTRVGWFGGVAERVGRDRRMDEGIGAAEGLVPVAGETAPGETGGAGLVVTPEGRGGGGDTPGEVRLDVLGRLTTPEPPGRTIGAGLAGLAKPGMGMMAAPAPVAPAADPVAAAPAGFGEAGLAAAGGAGRAPPGAGMMLAMSLRR